MMPQFSSKKAPWDLIQFSQSPSAALSYFPEFHQCSESSSLSKGNSFLALFLGKPRSRRTPNLGCRVPESTGWLDVPPKNSAQDMMHEQAHCCDEAANHQLPIAEASWIIQIVSMEECSSLTQNLVQICCSAHSVILNAMATLYTCSLNSMYSPPMISTVKLSLFMHVHPWPLFLVSRFHQCCANHSHYINNDWTFSR